MQLERTIARVQSTGTLLALVVLLASCLLVPLTAQDVSDTTAPCGELSAAALRSLDQSMQAARLKPAGRATHDLVPTHPAAACADADAWAPTDIAPMPQPTAPAVAPPPLAAPTDRFDRLIC